tara:strand:+ start:259 stop:663 length:405 start_codon:yes stop_codon:yes gene_type:complete
MKINKYNLLTYSCFIILISFLIYIIYAEFPKEKKETDELNEEYKKLSTQDFIENNEFLIYMAKVNGKACWRLSLLISMILTFVILSGIKILRYTNCNIFLFSAILLFTCFSFFYYFYNYINFHIFCGGRGCVAF